MASQLRVYRIKPGLLDEFTEFWRAEIVPLREAFGFAVEGAWADRETSTFAWVVGHPDFATGEAAYYASPQRAGLSRDPATFIEDSDLRLMERVPPA
ncbi:MAG TPA: hypothetical protein VFR49_16050 [Solirubrobacteraceae bacterium]|nr:hypothetical protein [Solirubrobacteraceae bacterium]